MISPYDDLTGRNKAVQSFLKMIKEKNKKDSKYYEILEKIWSAMFSKQYRQRYKEALKLQRWPLVDTAKMEKEKKERDRKARLRRLYGLPDDKLKT